MRLFPAACLLLLAFACVRSEAQSSSPSVGGGLFLAIGGESHDTPTQPSPVGTSLFGGYLEWDRRGIKPGVAIRGKGGTLGIRGVLVGPRISSQFGALHPYAEALFGPNHLESSPALPPNSAVVVDRKGITSELAVWVEAEFSRHFRWRVVEFTAGNFSGVPGSRPRSLSTGIVLHLP